MTDREVVSTATLTALAEWLISLAWPVTEAQMMDLTHRRRWAVTSAEAGEGADWDTGLVGSRSWAAAIVIDGVMAEMSLATAETFPKEAEGSLEFLRDVFAEQTRLLEDIAGPPAIRRPGANPVVSWDLPNGSSLELSVGGGTCTWVLNSPRAAEVDRRLGR
jgi:hypothetical protein